jgi:methionine-R-sulfoxide reductase
MKFISFILGLSLFVILPACAQQQPEKVSPALSELPPLITNPEDFNELSDFEQYVMIRKGTERAFSGVYHDIKSEGIYICKQCNNPLFRSSDKFDSRSGWPSFDDMIDENVKEVTDADGYRTEILCGNCDGHLGHVFRGEGFTEKQTRHCVNSASLNLVVQEEAEKKQTSERKQ